MSTPLALSNAKSSAKSAADAVTEADHCFQQALTIARKQQALALELRAAVSAARLAQQRNDGDEARDILEPVCQRVTEGFDTADYRDAIALLNEFG